jgi:hypothetical protein
MRPPPIMRQIRRPRRTPVQTWRTRRLWRVGSGEGPRVCLRKARRTETMMLVSRVSRKQMKKTGGLSQSTFCGGLLVVAMEGEMMVWWILPGTAKTFGAIV